MQTMTDTELTICPSCNWQAEPTDTFCSECGARIDPQTQYLVTVTNHGHTLIYADSPEDAAAQYASRLPKKPTAQMQGISDYAGERLYFFKAGRTAFSIRRSYEGD